MNFSKSKTYLGLMKTEHKRKNPLTNFLWEVRATPFPVSSKTNPYDLGIYRSKPRTVSLKMVWGKIRRFGVFNITRSARGCKTDSCMQVLKEWAGSERAEFYNGWEQQDEAEKARLHCEICKTIIRACTVFLLYTDTQDRTWYIMWYTPTT